LMKTPRARCILVQPTRAAPIFQQEYGLERPKRKTTSNV
jgi:hypothetical protein